MKARFLFRGKGIIGNVWVTGSLVTLEDKCGGYCQIVKMDGAKFEVRPETVGQCTGARDINGNLIFEGDILKAVQNNEKFVGAVYYKDAQWFGAGDYLEHTVAYNAGEVIGNIHANPELLEGEK